MLEGCPGRRKNVTGPERGRSRGADPDRVLAKIYNVEMDQDVEFASIAAMDRPHWGQGCPARRTYLSGQAASHNAVEESKAEGQKNE
jgi:hypothetical protein